MRLDQYLFRARLFKSRTKATEACRQGRVLLGDRALRASSEVREGMVLRIREKGLYRDIRILMLPGKNISKEDAKTTWSDETPEDVSHQRELLEKAMRLPHQRREGGRPTKKERRNLEKQRGR